MTWGWHAIWWLFVIELAAKALALVGNTGREAKRGEELVGERIVGGCIVGFIVYWLTVYAPWGNP